MSVAYLGPAASYTHQAALKVTGSAASLVPKTTIDDVFTAVQSGEADRGVVPFENSSNGSVVFTLDLFADLKGTNTDIVVTDEVYVAVNHCLVGQAQLATSRTEPTLDVSHITKIYSHPQAWGQCKDFLSTRLKGVERQDVSSTSRGAEIVKTEGPDSTSAAISSQLAAELNGLVVLAKGIEDSKGNTTRFFVIERQSTTTPIKAAASSSSSSSSKYKSMVSSSVSQYKSMVSFTIQHTSPGALADALAVFKKHDISLTSINTRPSGQQNWVYIFFVEFWGRTFTDDRVDAALAELQQAARSYRWLGSWKSASETATDAGTNIDHV